MIGFTYKKLFIPGPTEVRKEILKEMSKPMIGHRSKDFNKLFDEVVPKVNRLFYTKNKIFLSTSSSTGLMEAAIRNCVKKRCLNLMCGAFSDRWYQITVLNGKETDKLEVTWGRAVKPDMIEEKLNTGLYDSVTLVHNETSTGVMNPIKPISKVMKKYPNVMFLVDTVSSMAGVKIDVDELGIDVCLAGVQKAFALPPGLAICSVSDKVLERAKEVKNRGYYFDFLTFLKYYDKKQTPTTPALPQLYALNKQLDRIFEEGLENRYKRHKKMASFVRDWGKKNFDLFAEPGYESNTVTTITNTKKINVANLIEELGKRQMLIANGYGKLKEITFRIGHMGDLTLEEIKELIENIEEILGI